MRVVGTFHSLKVRFRDTTAPYRTVLFDKVLRAWLSCGIP